LGRKDTGLGTRSSFLNANSKTWVASPQGAIAFLTAPIFSFFSKKVMGTAPISKKMILKLISIGMTIIFAWSIVITPAMAETLKFEGGTVDVKVQDNVTNWDVTGNPVWNLPEFNVGQNSIYNIKGIGSGASLALLVNGGSASNVFGTMNLSNLAFILQNIAGINIGNTGAIHLNNASLIASTLPLNLKSTDFLTGDYQFSGEGKLLSNAGGITGGMGDVVALVANAIKNSGTIEVPMGTVALAAGKTVTVGISPDGMVSIGVDEATANSLGLKDQIKNTGAITADGGRVLLNAKAVDGLYDKAINIQRDASAVTVVRADNGTIEFKSLGDIYNDALIQATKGQVEMTSERGAVTNAGTVDATKGRLDIKARDDILNEALIKASEGKVFFDSSQGGIKNSGELEASKGSIEMKAQGDIETMGNLEAAYLREKAAAFRISGGYHVKQATHDNLDHAITFNANATVSGSEDGSSADGIISDNENIVVNAGVTLTLGSDFTFIADANADGTGALLMDSTATINGGASHYNLTLKASKTATGGNSTIGKVTDIGNLMLDAQTPGATYQVRNAVSMAGNLVVNSGATLTGGYSVTVGGGSVTGNGRINMTGGTFLVDGDGNFGGTTDWNFWRLYFGDGTGDAVTRKQGPNKVTALTELKIAPHQELKAGTSDWDLSWGGGYLTDVLQIVAGGEFVLALLSDGTLRSWGYNAFGQLGDGATYTDSNIPVTVFGLSGIKSIAAGLRHGLALKEDGTVYSWGWNNYGQLGRNVGGANFSNTPGIVRAVGDLTDALGGLKGVESIAAGDYHSLALFSGSKTVCAWGSNGWGQLGIGDAAITDSAAPVMVADLAGVAAIASGGKSSLALLSNGTLKSWGANSSGQLGDGTFDDQYAPVAVRNQNNDDSLSHVTSISVGYEFAMALLENGTVVTWGSNSKGQLGNGSGENSSLPVTVASLTGVEKISAGSNHAFAILANGSVKGWGLNEYSQLGDGTGLDHATPVDVPPLPRVLSIVGGNQFSAALMNDGSVKTWGDNWNGQLGNNSWTNSLTPVFAFSGFDETRLTNISQISAGIYHSLALKSDGSRVYAWGEGTLGQLGNGTWTSSSTPVEVLNEDGTGYLSNVASISAGSYHSLARLKDGTVRSWGDNEFGQLGNGKSGATEKSSKPVVVTGLSGVSDIAAGGFFSLAILAQGTVSIADDTVWSWGSNRYGQLGNGTEVDSSVPVQVHGVGDSGFLTGVSDIAAGWFHSLALLSDGAVNSWGRNNYGQLGNGIYANSPTPVFVKNTDGSGNLSGAKAIAAGAYHSLAITDAGTPLDLSDDFVQSWGFNGYGELGNPGGESPLPVTALGTTGARTISAGGYKSFAIMGDGTVYGWGDNNNGDLGGGGGVTGFSSLNEPVVLPNYATATALVGGWGHSMGLFPDHTVKSSGLNASWQLGINSDDMYSATPQNVKVLAHAPFTVEGTFTAEDSTFLYTGDYGFGRVVVTEIADVQYNNLILQGQLADYMVDRTFQSLTIEDLNRMARGRWAVLGDSLKSTDIAMKGDNPTTKRFDANSNFFNPRITPTLETIVTVVEGAVYIVDGANETSLLKQGESLKVGYKEKKKELEGSRPKPPHGKPAVVSPPAVPPGQDLAVKKPAVPVVVRSTADGTRYGTLKNPSKDVFVKCPGGEWQGAKDGMVILPGDVVKTAAAGSVEVLMEGGKVGRIEIKEGSIFRISRSEQDPLTGDKNTLLELAIGKLIAHVEKLSGKSSFEVQTPTALTGVRGTVFEVVVREKT